MGTKKPDSSTKRLEGIDVRASSYDIEKVQQITKLNQDLSKDYYRTKYWELARRLAAANTGEILLIEDDYALWLQEYAEDYNYETEEKELSPVHEVYGFNSEEYVNCAAEVHKKIMLHQANLFGQELLEERATLAAKAAELGFPSNLHFVCRDNDPGPSCQTWIIGANGVPRVRDYNVGDSDSHEFYEGWAQLLPHEVIATWRKDYMSAPHYFSLKLYVDLASVPKCLIHLTEPIPSSKTLVCLTIDSEMPPLNTKQQESLEAFFSMAQLECLGDLQANVDCTYRDAIDPIYGEPSPDIAGGWLGMLGIEQTFTIPEPEEDDADTESADEDDEEM